MISNNMLSGSESLQDNGRVMRAAMRLLIT